MNIITQESKKRQAIIKLANKKGKSHASRMYDVSLSSVKRWCKRYDGTWQSLKERSHRLHSHPRRHTEAEEKIILKIFHKKYLRYGWDEVSAEWYIRQNVLGLEERMPKNRQENMIVVIRN